MNVALSPREEARLRQAEASDPAASAWVGASAGSGKTKVLTDRVLRLLLTPGQAPGRILCLTFTKAAAAEMSTRLARQLGEWVALPESELAERLDRLLGRTPVREELDRARRLFAEVLELPGGMRISTIHAFCQSLLRAFPLEAGLPPQFGVVEEAEAAALLAEAREAVLGGAGADAAALQALAGLVPPQGFAQLVAALDGERQRLAAALRRAGQAAGLAQALARHLGLQDGMDEAAVIATGCRACPDLVPIARLKQASKNENDRARAERMLTWLALGHDGRATRWSDWSGIFLSKEGKPYAARTLATKGGLKDSFDRVIEAMQAEAERVFAVEGQRRACRLLAATTALVGIGAPILSRYGTAKAMRGMMDYDDLILAAQRVLEDPGSAWVLFKLDGGLDHVLLDEAQDSNPAQWGIAAALTEEFFSGLGAERGAAARDRPRTVFAVGDIKQAIYGFQGADPAGFATWKAHFSRATAAIGAGFRDVRLNVSFRSTAPVLSLVDAVFADGPAREGVVEPGEELSHRPDRLGHGGCVELWPMLESAPPEPPPPWAPPETPTGTEGADALLAEAIAARIASWLREGEVLPARGRRMRAGDILVLLRRRTGGFVPRLVRALKERNIPVGGADRIRLAEQIAVQDLLALGEVLLLPEDDLSLACVLKSPLVGLTEEDLFDLAHGRKGSLWARLAAHRGGEGRLGAAADWLARLMARADLVTPHALFAEILGEHRGREKLLARLGPDAADPLDEFLNAALAFERSHPPSLQAFLHWVRQGKAEVKREAESAGDAVRIMTVHGAKGLQAPVVILPDTVASGRGQSLVRWRDGEDGLPLPLWAPNQDHHAPAYTAAMAQEAEARRQEEHRLLYVALTRAEDRLLVAGWQRRAPKDAAWPEGCWYDLVARGFARLDSAVEDGFEPAGFGAPAACRFAGATLRRLACAQDCPCAPDGQDTPPPAAAELPGWTHAPAGPEAAAAEPLTPSALPGEESPAAAPHGIADPEGRRFRRGRLIHALLQHLPGRDPTERERAARRFLARPGHGLTPAEQEETLAEIMGVLDHPEIAPAFGPGSLAEAPIAGRLGGRPVSGQVDRLLVTPDRVLVLDYKTNRPPPATPEAVAPLYLRQMAAYRSVLQDIFPGRRVECALVWTYGARIMLLPGGLLDRHAQDA